MWVFFRFVLLKNIHFCASWQNIFSKLKNCPLHEAYTPLCISFRYTTFSSVENIYFVNLHKGRYSQMKKLREEYTPFCECFLIFSFENIYLCASWQKQCFPHLKMLYTWIIYTSVWVLLRRIYTFCVIWLKQCFLHLKMSSFWRIYTSERVYFNFFS